MGTVVGEHLVRQVRQHDPADALLFAPAMPPSGVDAGELRHVCPPGRREARQALVQRQRAVLPLAGNPSAIEIGQRGVVLREEARDSDSEALLFEVRQVPDVLDKREASTRPRRDDIARREPSTTA
jgi:hypothetical protein